MAFLGRFPEQTDQPNEKTARWEPFHALRHAVRGECRAPWMHEGYDFAEFKSFEAEFPVSYRSTAASVAAMILATPARSSRNCA